MGWLASHVKAWAPLSFGEGWRVAGPARPDPALISLFRSVPPDPLPDFVGREGMARGGRGRDHPRYGSFVHAFGRWLRPQEVLEVGTYAGGTTVGWARALLENGSGRITCVDDDSYARGIYPEMVAANLARLGFPAERARFVRGDSREQLPLLAGDLAGRVDACLVDGDHTYEGAMADLRNGLVLMRPGGFVLVHDLDPARTMPEATVEHPTPVLDAFRDFAREARIEDWYVLEFIRKHLGVLRIPPAPTDQ